jgi:DNA-directed RNA polymerase specialized sigma24 family protein
VHEVGPVNRDEFAELALGYFDDVTAFAQRLTSNAADADDLTQVTFGRAFRAWPTLRERGACRTGLFHIARNAHLNEQGSDTNTDAIQFGGGIDVRAIRWLGFRAEVRDVYTGSRNFSIATPAPRVHNVVTSGGLVLRF